MSSLFTKKRLSNQDRPDLKVFSVTQTNFYIGDNVRKHFDL